MKRKRGCLLPVIIVFFAFCAIVTIMMQVIDPSELGRNQAFVASKYIDVSKEQGKQIDDILVQCGLTEITGWEHDELLDAAHMESETGYRLTSNGIDNIILYLDANDNVYSIRYADYDLYANGAVTATLSDYCLTTKEMSDWQTLCQDKVKEELKTPSTAKFPNILEWKFGKNKNIITVQAYVDAQNGFGAQIRSDFQFIINSDDNTIQSFILDGTELISQ